MADRKTRMAISLRLAAINFWMGRMESFEDDFTGERDVVCPTAGSGNAEIPRTALLRSGHPHFSREPKAGMGSEGIEPPTNCV